MTGKASFDTLVLQEAFRYLYHKLPMFQFTCPTVESQPVLVRVCKLCKSEKVVINQTLKKQVKDSLLTEVIILRLRCKTCKYSFRVYPDGVKDYSGRTKRLVFLGVLLYSCGLSYEKVAGFLTSMIGRDLASFVTIWRDVQVIGERLRRRNTPRLATQVVVGLDGTYVRVKGQEQPVLMAINTKDGTTMTVSLANEWKERELRQFLWELAKEVGIKHIEGIITDDLDTYKIAAEKQKISSHQVCLAHVKRNIGKRLAKLTKKLPAAYLQQIRTVLDPPTQEGEVQLRQLLRDEKLWRNGKRNKHWVALRMIVGDLLRNWKNYTAFLTHPPGFIPTTNNRTEQAIGRSKIRYKTTRGFKSKPAVLNFFSLTQAYGMKQYDQIASVC